MLNLRYLRRLILRRSWKETIRASTDYVLIVWCGIALGLALVNSFRPGTAELYNGPYSPVRVRASLFVLYGYVTVALSLPGLFVGALLSLGERLGQQSGIPRLLLRIAGAICSVALTVGLLSITMHLFVGDLISMTVAFALGSLLSLAYGAVFLVRLPESSPDRLAIRHWLVLALPALFILQFAWGVTVRASVNEPVPTTAFLRWTPGPEDLTYKHFDYELYCDMPTDQDMNSLRALGLRGQLRSAGGGCGARNANRLMVVMYRPIHEDVDLPKPKDSDLIYVQTSEGWKKLPESAATSSRCIRLSYAAPTAQESDVKTKYVEDRGLGLTGRATTLFSLVLGKPLDYRMPAFSWSNDDEKIEPSVGSLSPPSQSPPTQPQ